MSVGMVESGSLGVVVGVGVCCDILAMASVVWREFVCIYTWVLDRCLWPSRAWRTGSWHPESRRRIAKV